MIFTQDDGDATKAKAYHCANSESGDTSATNRQSVKCGVLTVRYIRAAAGAVGEQ